LAFQDTEGKEGRNTQRNSYSKSEGNFIHIT
jgi:hypothetical protein